MIDKVWYDWQNRDPVNANSFNGGAVEQIANLTIYDVWPNGGAPFQDVSTRVLVRLEMEEFMLTWFG